MSNENLKPCPFCGKRDTRVATFPMLDWDDYAIRCNSCGAQTRQVSTIEQAVEDWNRREE